MSLRISIPVLIFSLVLTSCKHEPMEVFLVEEPISQTGDGVPCDPDSVYFVNDILPLLLSNCAFSGCHGDGSAQEGVDLTNYNSVIITADVDPFDLNGSDLYEVITETDPDKLMPPPGEGSLSSTQIDLIADWINQGALNNACENCDSLAVTFSGTIKPMTDSRCKGCHSGASPSGSITLANYNQISTLALNGSLFGAINHDMGFVPMPYNQPKLPQCQIDQVAQWIADGAPNN